MEVVELAEGGAAQRAGVRVGDYVLSAGGQPLEKSKDLLRVRRQVRVGDELPMTLWRSGATVEVVLSLQESLEETE